MIAKSILALLFLFLNTIAYSQWKYVAPLPNIGRDDGIMVAANSKLYAGFGALQNHQYKNDFYAYSPETDTWHEIENVPLTARQYLSALAIDKYIFIGGGIDTAKMGVVDFWRYNTQENTWFKMKDFPGKARWGAVIFHYNSKLYYGLGTNGPEYFTDIYEYDILNDSWKFWQHVPGLGRFYAMAAVINKKLLIGLGHNNKIAQNDLYIYSWMQQKWQTYDGELPKARSYIECIVHNNKILIGTGQNIFNEITKSFEVLDLENNSISTLFESNAIRGYRLAAINNTVYQCFGIDINENKNNYLVAYTLDTFFEKTPYKSSLYPNPVTNQLVLYSSDFKESEIINISLYTLAGNVVYSKHFLSSSEIFQMDVSTITNGMYVVKVSDSNGTNLLTYKVVKL